LSKRDTIELKSNDFVKVLAIVVGMAFVMVSVAYGITYILEINPYPVPLHYIFFLFAIGFVVFSVYFERDRGAIYPWSLMGGAIVSAIVSFILTAAIGGLLYISEKGFIVLGTDSWFYALSICIILSMILFNLAKNKL
jgi:Zn-dependent protease